MHWSVVDPHSYRMTMQCQWDQVHKCGTCWGGNAASTCLLLRHWNIKLVHLMSHSSVSVLSGVRKIWFGSVLTLHQWNGIIVVLLFCHNDGNREYNMMENAFLLYSFELLFKAWNTRKKDSSQYVKWCRINFIIVVLILPYIN